MAEFYGGQTTYTAGSEVGRVFIGGVEADYVFAMGRQIMPADPVPIYGRCKSRVVSDANQRWFELGTKWSSADMGGLGLVWMPDTGWKDEGDYTRYELEWSHDLVNWSVGKFVPAPTPFVDLGGGQYEYWVRALNPVDSAVKSGEIRVSSGYNGQLGNIGDGDTRNNPFTGLTVAGVVLALGGGSGFPYTMPGDAARMQTDLRVFYPTATVEASSATVWRIIIPAVNYTSYTATSRVSWPVYLIADMFGVVNQPVDGASFTGAMVNAAGVPIYGNAFGRIKIHPGGRYDP